MGIVKLDVLDMRHPGSVTTLPTPTAKIWVWHHSRCVRSISLIRFESKALLFDGRFQPKVGSH